MKLPVPRPRPGSGFVPPGGGAGAGAVPRGRAGAPGPPPNVAPAAQPGAYQCYQRCWNLYGDDPQNLQLCLASCG